MVTFIVVRHQGKICAAPDDRLIPLPKSLVERLCDLKVYAISVLSFSGSVCTPDKATLKAENHALQCTTARPYTAIPSELREVGSVCGLSPDLVGINSINLAARSQQMSGKSQCRTRAQLRLGS